MKTVHFSDDNNILSLAAISNIGDREEQQDSFGHSLKENECLAVICDGMGGHREGSRASSIAVDMIISSYVEHYPCDDCQELIKQAMIDVDNKISKLADQKGELLLAGTTAVSIYIRKNNMYWVSVGDSRAYLFRDNQVAQLTKDHTYSTVLDEQLRAGLIDEKKFNIEAPKGQKLINYIGIGNLSLIDYNISPLSLHKDDRILLASDGLYKHVSKEEMLNIFTSTGSTTECLNKLEKTVENNARTNGVKRDNLTAIILKIK